MKRDDAFHLLRLTSVNNFKIQLHSSVRKTLQYLQEFRNGSGKLDCLN